MSETNGGVVQTNGNRKMSREEKLREAKIEEQVCLHQYNKLKGI